MGSVCEALADPKGVLGTSPFSVQFIFPFHAVFENIGQSNGFAHTPLGLAPLSGEILDPPR